MHKRSIVPGGGTLGSLTWSVGLFFLSELWVHKGTNMCKNNVRVTEIIIFSSTSALWK